MNNPRTIACRVVAGVRRRSFLRSRWAVWTLAGLVGACFGLLVFVVLQLRSYPPPDSRVPPDLTPDLTVVVSPGLLAALIQQSADSGQSHVPLENVRVETLDGVIRVRGNLTVIGQRVGGTADLIPQVRDGTVALVIRRARFGLVPVPGNLTELAQGPLNERITAATGGLPADVTSVQVDQRGVTITARIRLDELPLHVR